MFDISPIQVIIVLVIALLVFGPKRLPEMGRSIGRGIREFKGSIMDDERPPAGSRAPEPQAPPAASASAVARGEDDDEVLEGVVVPGDTPPRPPAA